MYIKKGELISFNYLSVCDDMEAQQLMNLDVEEERQDDEKNRCEQNGRFMSVLNGGGYTSQRSY